MFSNNDIFCFQIMTFFCPQINGFSRLSIFNGFFLSAINDFIIQETLYSNIHTLVKASSWWVSISFGVHFFLHPSQRKEKTFFIFFILIESISFHLRIHCICTLYTVYCRILRERYKKKCTHN